MKSTCQHCGKEIIHRQGHIWHDDSRIFPQYCETPVAGSRLHEPKRYTGRLAENIVQARSGPKCDLYFYPMKEGSPCLRVKKSADEPGYLFQCLDQAMDIQVETYHANLSDALQQVALRMRVEGEPKYRVEAL